MAKQIENPKLQDSGIEASILSGILQHGPDCLLDIDDIISANDFYWRHNQNIYNILQYLVKEKDIKTFDIPTILSASKEKSIEIIKDKDPSDYIESLFNYQLISKENIQKLALVIYKLSLARSGVKCAISIKDDLLNITGQEKIDEIINKIEDPIFNFTNNLISDKNNIKPICENFIETLKTLASDPKDIIGLPSGYKKWDTAIGGGLRRGTVNIIGARSKVGKSYWCLNVAKNIAEQNIPVLYLDTELTQVEQMARLISLISGIDKERIETGKFGKNIDEKKAIWQHKDLLEKIPIKHCSISGQNLQHALSMTRKWLFKYVGFSQNGQANPCLLIYDYLKLTNASDIKSNMQEHQLLGFLISSLHDFAMQWGIPILATVQLNRDGVTEEGGHVAAGSDRILWLGSNFSILKAKTTKEFVEDPPINGNKKLIVTDTRYGPGMPSGEYINIVDKLNISKLEEGKYRSEVINENFSNEAIQ